MYEEDEVEIPIYLITGFLESGKTSFINFTVAQDYFQIDGPTLLITTEEGEVEYDEKELLKHNTVLEIVEGPEQFTLDYLKKLNRKYRPERIILEYNPLWSVKKLEEMELPRGWGIVQEIVTATEDVWGTEYLDAIISVKIVSSIEEAIAHINKYNTGHSESIITKDYTNALKFQDEIDAAAVYVNASTRFTDGFEFGFGAEIGISTQKLHARGPMGLEALTTTKYVIFGDGQIRP